MRNKFNTHVTGEHNINGDHNEALTGFQKANVNLTKTESGIGGFLFGVMLLILFGINAAFMLYVKNELSSMKQDFNDKQINFEQTFNKQIDILHTRIDKRILQE